MIETETWQDYLFGLYKYFLFDYRIYSNHIAALNITLYQELGLFSKWAMEFPNCLPTANHLLTLPLSHL